MLTVIVHVEASPGQEFGWGFLSTRPHNIRIFKGPCETCPYHTWDAIILRDCTPNTDTLWRVEAVASRKWDILCMKMCEDYDRECYHVKLANNTNVLLPDPWVVVAVNDAGPTPGPNTHDCQDTSACGCILAH